MTDITIPPEAVEAAARAYAIANEGHDKWWHLRAERITAALRAGLAAWPGMHTEDHDTPWPPRIILPLPKDPAVMERMIDRIEDMAIDVLGGAPKKSRTKAEGWEGL